jgi:cbb3-type cytochrome oxidase maturation protein
MSVLYIALPLALLLGGAALVACIRCIQGGQYDDLETPAVRMLIDDPAVPIQPRKSSQPKSNPAPKL